MGSRTHSLGAKASFKVNQLSVKLKDDVMKCPLGLGLDEFQVWIL